MKYDVNLFEGLSEEEIKTCNQCLQELPISRFPFNSGASHRRAKCKECEKEQVRQRKKYNYLKAPVNHICPICQRNEDQCAGKGGKKVGTWCLDHDHKTGNMRGWLCHECNRALGNFKDDIVLLKRALQYLGGNNDLSSN